MLISANRVQQSSRACQLLLRGMRAHGRATVVQVHRALCSAAAPLVREMFHSGGLHLWTEHDVRGRVNESPA
jgi:hypothetical protein